MCLGDGSEVCEWSLFSGVADGVGDGVGDGDGFIDWVIVV